MNTVCQLFNIEKPIIQAGMVWCSGWKLAAAVSEAGGLGLIGAGSMYPDVLEHHIKKCNEATKKPFGVNIPLLYPQTDDLIEIVIRQKVPIVFTSAGNPQKYTAVLKQHHITVVHVIANSKFAQKALDAGADALVAEGFEAGGHNGKEETTTMCLVPVIRALTDKPLIAAGGIATGAGMLAAFSLGADGVQIGSAFAIAEESSAHQKFKEKILSTIEGDTLLSLKKLSPVRLLKNDFFNIVNEAEKNGADEAQLSAILGRGRAKKGMFEGDLENGELEIGQIATLLKEIKPAKEILNSLWESFLKEKSKIANLKF